MNVQGFFECVWVFQDTPFHPFGFHGLRVLPNRGDPHSCPHEQVLPMSYSRRVLVVDDLMG